MPRADGRAYHFETAKEAAAGLARTKELHAEITKKPKRKNHPRSIKQAMALVAKGKPGRPAGIKDSPAVVNGVCGRIMDGLHIESALILAGMSRANVPNWLKLHPKAALMFEAAEVAWEEKLVRRVEAFSKEDVKAAQWLMERRAARKWAPLTKTEVTGKDGAALQSMTLSKVLLATVSSQADTLERVKPIATKLVTGLIPKQSPAIDV